MTLGTAAVAIAALAGIAVGGAGAWVAVARVARRRHARLAGKSRALVAAAQAETAASDLRAAQAADDLVWAWGRLSAVEADLLSASRALADRTAELERARSLVADLGVAAERQREALGRDSRRQAALVEEVGELQRQLDLASSERQRLGERAAALERELLTARESGEQREAEHRRELARGNGLLERARQEAALMARRHADAVERLTRERDEATAALERLSETAQAGDLGRRRLAVELEKVAAERQARLGALEARAERVDALVRQLEDRDALARAAMFERDEARRRLVRLERESADRAAALQSEVARLTEQVRQVDDHARAVAAAERRLATTAKERDLAIAETRRLASAAATLRSELAERNARFRELSAENADLVRRLEQRLADLEAELAIARSPVGANGRNGGPNGAHDDLRRIRGIGPVMAERLAREGVERFTQIAAWTDADIERVARVLEVHPARIRREDWVGSARRFAHEAGGTAG